MGGGHGGVPEKLVLPPDGVDPLPPQSEWLDIYNGKPLEDFPEEIKKDPLKLYNWYNYQDKELPGFFLSQEENLRLWQEIQHDRILDHHPCHEIHSKDLPDYHFWPMIQNDKEAKFTGQVSELVQFQYHTDQAEIPRFHKNGVPKTPPQEQMWYHPLDQNGRCDWKGIVARFCHTDSYFSERGWSQRYLRWVHRDPFIQWNQSMKLLDVAKPIFWKHRELNRITRFWRNRRGSFMTWPIHMGVFYLYVFGSISGAGLAKWDTLVFENDCWNYDHHYMAYFRDQGAWHPPA